MNVYLQMGAEYKYDLARWLIERDDVDEVYMDYYSTWDNQNRLSSGKMHFVNMEEIRDYLAPDKLNIDDYPMPSKNLLLKLREYESMAIQLGTRESNYPIHAYEESKRCYYFYVRLWHAKLDEIKPGFIFFEETPHCMATYVLYALARVRDIPLLLINPTGIRLDNYSGGVYTYGRSISGIGSDIEAYYNHIKNKSANDIELDGKVGIYYERSKNGLNEAAISQEAKDKWAKFTFQSFYAPYIKKTYRLNYLLCSFAKRIGWKGRKGGFEKVTFFDITREKELSEKAIRYVKNNTISLGHYDKLAVSPNYDEKYIYYPLQQFPEMTLTPLAGVYGEQYNAIQMLSRITEPYGVYIYIKEYFIQPFRDKKFWQDVTRLKNVRLIKSSVPSIDMIRGSIAVANATGTCLMEAVFEKKPALTFGGGHNWKGMPGLFEVISEKQGKDIVRDILTGFEIPLDDLKKYFLSIQKNSIEYYINSDYTVDRGVEYDRTLVNLKGLLEKELNKLEMSKQ